MASDAEKEAEENKAKARRASLDAALAGDHKTAATYRKVHAFLEKTPKSSKKDKK